MQTGREIQQKANLTLSNPNASSATTKEKKMMRILSQNVDDHPGYRFPNGRLGYISKSFPELSFECRFPLFEVFYQTEINENNVNLFVLQEVSNNAKKLFEKFFEKQGFEFISVKYCNDKESLNYIVAYKKGDYTLKNTSQIYFTTDGKSYTDEERASVIAKDKANNTNELFKHNFDTEFEKSIQLVTLQYDDKEFIVGNIQPGLTNKHRELVMSKLCEELKSESRPTLLMGDFNQFDSSKAESAIYDKQIKIFQDNGFNWDTEHLMNEGIKATFIAHPFDILRFFTKDTIVSGTKIPGDFTRLDDLKTKGDYKGIRSLFLEVITREKLDLVSTCLDALFSKNFDKSVKIETESHTWLGKLVNTAQANRSDIQKLVLQGLSAEATTTTSSVKEEEKVSDAQNPPRPSDHTAILTTIKLG